MDIGLIVLLILLNGLFALAEIAMVSARKARLQTLAEQGRPGASAALALQGDPSRFLATIQVGITTVGVLSGALGESALAEPIAAWLSQMPVLEPYARGIALALTVMSITYLSVVVGELVPKRLALLSPETLASLVARPMNRLSAIAAPLVWLLSASSSALLFLLGVRNREEPPISDDEIKVLMEQGAEAGVFHASERKLVSNVLHLDEQAVAAIMTPRTQVYTIDLDMPQAEQLERIAESPYGRLVLCRGGSERVVGVLNRGNLLKPALAGMPIDLQEAMELPVYVHESTTSTQLLERLRQTHKEFAIIVDEFDDMQGIVTLTDVLGAIVGDVPGEPDDDEPTMILRKDGSWLVDGGLGIERLKEVLDIRAAFPEESDYHTVAGFIMHSLRRIPTVADSCDHDGWHFEVVDMDRTKIDKVLVVHVDETGLL